jgi:hypothetical protein
MTWRAQLVFTSQSLPEDIEVVFVGRHTERLVAKQLAVRGKVGIMQQDGKARRLRVVAWEAPWHLTMNQTYGRDPLRGFFILVTSR